MALSYSSLQMKENPIKENISAESSVSVKSFDLPNASPLPGLSFAILSKKRQSSGFVLQSFEKLRYR